MDRARDTADVAAPRLAGLPPGGLRAPVRDARPSGVLRPVRAVLLTPRPRGTDRGLATALALAQFVGLAAYSLRCHEMWRDEAQAWLIARDNGLAGMFSALRYEGHPGLWQLILFAPAHLGAPVESMQVIHAAIAAASTWVLVRYAPFPLAAKLLFPLGYLAAYEYGVVARNYGLGMLGVLVFCALCTAARVRSGALALTLALLAQTSVVAATLVPALCLYGFHLVWERRAGEPARRSLRRAGCLAVAAGAGLLVMWLQVRPHPETWRFDGPNDRWVAVAGDVYDAMFPVPRGGAGFWQTEVYRPGERGLVACALLACLAVAAAVARRPVAVALYLGGLAPLAGFFHLVVNGQLRHHGFFFVWALACLWLGMAGPDLPRLDGRPRGLPVAAPVLLVAALGVQAWGGVVALRADAGATFSHARAAAAVLDDPPYAGRTLVLNGDYQTSPILAYLGRQGHYVNSADRSWIVWDTDRLRYPTTEEVVARARELRDEYAHPVVVVSADPLSDPHLQPTGEVTGPATVPEESYYLYDLVDP